MPPPSKNFNAPGDNEIDVDSPGNETLMTKLRDALIHLEEWLGKNFIAAIDHDHDGVNSKSVTNIGQSQIVAGAIGQGELKTTTGEVSSSVGGSIREAENLTLPGGEYGFSPQFKVENSSLHLVAMWADADVNGAFDSTTDNFTSTSYISNILLGGVNGSGGSLDAYAQQRYIQASPPYKIGNKNWGHFLFILRNISTGEIKSSYQAEDPPWAYNGPEHNAKDSKERIEAVPHPFPRYWDRDPALDGFEIVLIDLRDCDVKEWKKEKGKEGKSILEDLAQFNPQGKIIKPTDLEIAEINGFTNKVKIRKR